MCRKQTHVIIITRERKRAQNRKLENLFNVGNKQQTTYFISRGTQQWGPYQTKKHSMKKNARKQKTKKENNTQQKDQKKKTNTNKRR